MPSQRETILQYLLLTLFPTMTIANGFTFGLVTIERGIRAYTSLHDGQFPAMFISSADETRKNTTSKHFMSDMNVFLVGYISKTEPPGGIQVQLDRFIADVTKLLYTDPKQGGRVNWTEITRVDTDPGDLQNAAAVAIEVNFNYMNQAVTP